MSEDTTKKEGPAGQNGDTGIHDPQWTDKASEFLSVFSKGAQFTEELLGENKRLRYKLAASQQELTESKQLHNSDEAVLELQRRYQELDKNHKDLLAKISNIEEENQNFARRYVEIEEENNNLANLYIASFQLHSTLNFREVIQIILEIVINLIGAEKFAVYVFDEQVKAFAPAASEGVDHESLEILAVNQKEVARKMSQPDVIIDDVLLASGNADPDHPLVVIPLRLKEDNVGAISIFALLEQKDGIADVDRELFTLLAGHAATAIFSSRLYMESERKLNTMQGFIDLLTK